MIKPKKNNTSKMKANKKVVDGIRFDSTMEADYYEYLKQEKEEGRIVSFELQPEYTLLEDYEKYGRKIRGIKYIADFCVQYPDGTYRTIDVKGRETPDFKLKRKMFDARYPNIYLQLIVYNAKDKEWVDFDEDKKRKSLDKRRKKAAKKKEGK